MNSKELRNRLFIVGIFALAMGFLEAIVVVYLRELYYPEGFSFPLKLMSERIYLYELLRELATLVMLLTVGILAGKTAWERFVWFLYSFGVWDIFYYVALKVLLNWPDSILTWDILFLIPVTWTGPVLAPVISSLLMIGICLLTLFLGRKGFSRGYDKYAWTMLLAGAALTYYSYTRDFTRFLTERNFFPDVSSLFTDPRFAEALGQFVPDTFGWGWHIAGSTLILGSMGWHYYKYAVGEKKE